MTTETNRRVALLDTTLQIDRKKMGARGEYIESVLREYDWTIATGLSLVEFKAVLIQQLITIHNQLRRKGSRFTRARDALLEKQHPQRALRIHIFNNLIDVWGNSHVVGVEEDERLARKARLQIETVIPELYDWFKAESASAYLNDSRIRCTRADEAPRKTGKAFDVNLPKCRIGKNRFCRVEDFIRREAGQMIQRLEELGDPAEEPSEDYRQLLKAREVFRRVFENEGSCLSVGDCRAAGDCLISLEGQSIASEALSTNAKEWETLCRWAGYTFRHVCYPDENTH